MPSSEVRYQRGDHYRQYDEDLLQQKRSVASSTASSSVLSGQHRKKHARTKARSKQSVVSGCSNSLDTASMHRQPGCYPGQQEPDYLTKKKVEVKTTKNTEKRVQRCIVLEDGRIIEHDDPHIIVDTVEDTQTHEFDHLDDQELSSKLQASIERSYRRAGLDVKEVRQAHLRPRKSLAYKDPSDPTISSTNLVRAHQNKSDAGNDIVNDTFKRIVNTHDVRENIVRTHAAKDLGMISKKGLRKVLNKQGKVSDYIKYDHSEDHSDHYRGKRRKDKSATARKYEKESHRRIVDTQDTHQISRRMKDGQIRTETVKNEMHEIFDNKAAPDSDSKAVSGSSETELEKDEQQFRLRKTHEFTDYYDGRGNFLSNGPNITSKDSKLVRPHHASMEKWADILGEERVQQHRRSMKKKLRPSEDAERTDALTKRPLDLNREERTRKKETDKWLERHFGSDWSLAGKSGSSGNFKYVDSSHDFSSMFDPNKVRRTMSFSSIPIKYTNPGEKVSRVIKQTTTTIRPGFDKHVVSSVTKAMIPNGPDSGSLDASKSRPYHSTLTLATESRPLFETSKRHAASTTSLAARDNHETSHMTLRKVPITRILPPDTDTDRLQPGNSRPPKKNQRVQHLIDAEVGSSTGRSSGGRARSTTQRRSYFYGEEPRVQSEPPKAKMKPWNGDTPLVRRAPLYRTELLKTSDKMYVDEVVTSDRRQELSKSYHDISMNNGLSSDKKEMSQSYRQLPKPSRLFGWSDEFDLHGYGGLRGMERSEGVHRSKSFAYQPPEGSDRDPSFSGHYEQERLDEEGYGYFSGRKRHKTKSYKDTKVSNFMDEPIEPPQEFAGLDAHIQKKYNVAKHCLKARGQGAVATASAKENAVYEFERKIPMQSSILEAQKFKTVIFVSGN